jgi:hypothetical protein
VCQTRALLLDTQQYLNPGCTRLVAEFYGHVWGRNRLVWLQIIRAFVAGSRGWRQSHYKLVYTSTVINSACAFSLAKPRGTNTYDA